MVVLITWVPMGLILIYSLYSYIILYLFLFPKKNTSFQHYLQTEVSIETKDTCSRKSYLCDDEMQWYKAFNMLHRSS